MNTLKTLGIALLSILIHITFVSCGNNDNSLPEANYYIDINGEKIYPEETINIKDSKRIHNLSLGDANGKADFRNVEMILNGTVDIIEHNPTYIRFRSNNAGTCELIVSDYDTNQTYKFNIIVEEIDVKETFEIRTNFGPYDEANKKGPFVILQTTNKIEADAMKDFFTWWRFKILSFGSDKETCYPSYNADVSWGRLCLSSMSGNGYFYTNYCGKITVTNNLEYLFFKFSYGNTTHEVRRYIDSEECLWNGEWKK